MRFGEPEPWSRMSERMKHRYLGQIHVSVAKGDRVIRLRLTENTEPALRAYLTSR